MPHSISSSSFHVNNNLTDKKLARGLNGVLPEGLQSFREHFSVPSIPQRRPFVSETVAALAAKRDHASSFYQLNKKTDLKPSYRVLNDQIEANQKARKARSKDIQKLLLLERITGKSIFDQKSHSGGPSYLEHNAGTWGDLQSNENIDDLKYYEGIVSQCGKSAVWLLGQDTENFYLKKIDCRKPWCPVCGGKGGKIHNARLHSILSRMNPEKYNLRQFVFTIPSELRLFFQSAEKLSMLPAVAKSVIERFFGEPVFDKKGHIKKYKLVKGVVEYLHLFGEELGIFKPHVNIHIFEDKKEKLKLDASVLEAIKKCWLKKIKAISGNEELSVIDVQYSFRTTTKKNIHSMKYMSRPWSAEDYAAIEDEDLKRFLVIDLKGFLYIRFWGAMANCKYKDEMSLSEVKEEVESVVGEKLNMLFIAPFDEAAWSGKTDLIGDGLYRVRKRNNAEEEKSFRECLDYFSGQSG